MAMLSGCDTEVENIVIQRPNEYSEQYFDDLRAWKLTEHEVSYAYFASYTNAKAPTSWGERFLGLPDSLDIVNLWSDIPTPDIYYASLPPILLRGVGGDIYIPNAGIH